MTSFMPDFAGRRVTACAIIVAAIGSACLNVWGAFQIFPDPMTGTIFAVVISACEVIAALALRHIMRDFENHRYWKARLGSIIFLTAVAGCVFSGKQAFHILFLEAEANYTRLEIRAAARQAEADKYHANMLGDKLGGLNPDTARRRWEHKQDQADQKRLEMLKAKPPHEAIVVILLALFEMVKIGGLYALATPSTKGRTWSQRKGDKRRAEIADIEAERKHKERVQQLRVVSDDRSEAA